MNESDYPIPEQVIVDTTTALTVFRTALSTVPMDPSKKLEYESTIVEYILKSSEAKYNLQEYIRECFEDLSANNGDSWMRHYATLVLESIGTLGQNLVAAFTQQGLYNKQGEMWYTHLSYVNTDMVLYRIPKPRELIF